MIFPQSIFLLNFNRQYFATEDRVRLVRPLTLPTFYDRNLSCKEGRGREDTSRIPTNGQIEEARRETRIRYPRETSVRGMESFEWWWLCIRDFFAVRRRKRKRKNEK